MLGVLIMTKQKLFRWSNIGFAQIALGLFLAIIGACVIFVTPWTMQPSRITYGADGFYFVFAAILGFGFFGGSYALIQRFQLYISLTRDKFRMSLLLATTVLLLLQLGIFFNARFVAGWDVSAVTFLNRGGSVTDPWFQSYVSLFPNQIFLEACNYLVGRAAALFGVENSYSILVLLNILLVNISCALIACSVAKIAGRCTGLIAWLVAAVFLGLSPWILVPYSDTIGLFFSALMLTIFLLDQNGVRRWVLLGLLTAVAMAIKPTLLAFGGCVVLLTGLKRIAHFFMARKTACEHTAEHATPQYSHPCSVKEFLPILIFICGFVLGTLLVSGVKRTLPVQPDGVSQVGAAHYLMMGHNEAAEGGFSGEDYEFSKSFASPQERKTADLQRFSERLQQMGPSGAMTLYGKKLAKIYSNGSFFWFGEGSFVSTGQRDTVLAKFFGIGNKVIPYVPLAQLMWYCILLGCVFSCFLPMRGKISIQAMCLSIIALTLFLMLFEARARYLLQMSPYFVVLSVLGWSSQIQRLFAHDK